MNILGWKSCTAGEVALINFRYGTLVPIQYAIYSTHYTVYSAWSLKVWRMAFAVAFTVGFTAGFLAPLPKPTCPLKVNPCGNQGAWEV